MQELLIINSSSKAATTQYGINKNFFFLKYEGKGNSDKWHSHAVDFKKSMYYELDRGNDIFSESPYLLQSGEWSVPKELLSVELLDEMSYLDYPAILYKCTYRYNGDHSLSGETTIRYKVYVEISELKKFTPSLSDLGLLAPIYNKEECAHNFHLCLKDYSYSYSGNLSILSEVTEIKIKDVNVSFLI